MVFVIWGSNKGIRQSNEDAHNIVINYDKHIPNIHCANLIGIYDGHGGKAVSSLLSKMIPKVFLNKHICYPISESVAVNKCKLIQNYLKEKHTAAATATGSTCLCTIHYKLNGKFYLDIINIGDSRAVLCRNNIALPLTKDHKPSWPEEQKRITEEGGKIHFDGADWRIGELSVSRAFGDLSSKHVDPVPDVFHYELNNSDKFVVLGCDGLWDVLSPQDAVNFILNECNDSKNYNLLYNKGNIADKLSKFAIQCGSTDNVTAIILFL